MKFFLDNCNPLIDSLRSMGFIDPLGNFKLEDQGAACESLSERTGFIITPGDHIWEINVDIEAGSSEHFHFLLRWS